MNNIWILDDDKSIRWVFEKALGKENLPYKTFSNTNEAINQFNHETPSVIVSDIRMPGESGLTFLTKVKAKFPEIPIIIMTAYSDLDTAVSAFKSGAFEYIAKPFDIDKVIELIRKASSESIKNQDVIQTSEIFPDIIGQAPSMQEVFRSIGRLSQSSATVLLNGESGSGKELIAKAIHKHSQRNDKPFIAINTSAIPKDLLEAELFGHEKGAFTGADSLREGRFEQANDGTLFLDEIGDMPIDLQKRLLRVLREGKFHRVGGKNSITVNVRVIAATHQNLESYVKEKKFREDLFHRLNVIRIQVPPLRSRIVDIPILAHFFLTSSAKQLNVEPKILSVEVLDYFKNLHWQGNVRQLENVCHWLTVMSPGNTVNISDLPSELRNEPVSTNFDSLSWEEALKKNITNEIIEGTPNIHELFIGIAEKALIEASLVQSKGRKADAANILGIGRNTITRKIRELNIKK